MDTYKRTNVKSQNSHALALLLFPVLLGITSCGYQLQRPFSIDEQYQPVYVRGNSILSIALKQRLKENSIPLSNSRKTANSVMQFEHFKTDRRSNAVNFDGRDIEFLSLYHTQFSWQDNNSAIVEATPLQVETVQVVNPDRPTAQHSKNEVTQAELVSSIIDRTLDYIRFKKNR